MSFNWLFCENTHSFHIFKEVIKLINDKKIRLSIIN